VPQEGMMSYLKGKKSLMDKKVCHLKLKYMCLLGCALTFASEAKFEIEVKISFRFEAKKKPDFT
jgi:hypothetical protein